MRVLSNDGFICERGAICYLEQTSILRPSIVTIQARSAKRWRSKGMTKRKSWSE